MKTNASTQHQLGSHFDSQPPPRRRSVAPAPPSHDTCKIDRDRAENEGMVPPPPKPKPKAEAKMEGEGSYSAARRYREALEESIKLGNVNALAEGAAEALDGAEGPELRRAEKAAKHGRFSARQHHAFSHSHH